MPSNCWRSVPRARSDPPETQQSRSWEIMVAIMCLVNILEVAEEVELLWLAAVSLSTIVVAAVVKVILLLSQEQTKYSVQEALLVEEAQIVVEVLELTPEVQVLDQVGLACKTEVVAEVVEGHLDRAAVVALVVLE
jgi:hypothetical protein